MNKNWLSVTLGDIFNIARGGSPRPIQSFITSDPGGVNWIMIGDASEESRYITSTKKRILKSGVSKSRMVNPGDFLLTNSMSFGHPYIMKTSGCIHDGWLVLSAKENNIDQNYFYHLLGSKTVYREFSQRAAGTTVKNLNINLVRGVKISLPPLEEQKRIAAILDKADAIRRKRKEAIRLTEELLRSLFLDMFGDIKGNNWQLCKVESIIAKDKGSIRTGPFGSQLLHSEFVDEGIAVLGIDNAVQNEFQWAKPRFITEQKYASLKRYTVKPNDVIITIMGTCGRCAIIPENIPTAINTKHLCCITLDQGKCLPEFLHSYFLFHPEARKYLKKSVKGAIMEGLNMTIIKNLSVPLVPISLQQEYQSMHQKQFELRNKITSLETEDNNLFNSLLQKAFRGEL